MNAWRGTGLDERRGNVFPRIRGGHTILVVVIALLLFAPTAAHASHFDNMFDSANFQGGYPLCLKQSLCRTDNATLTVFQQSTVNAAMRQGVVNTLNRSYATTDLTIVYHTYSNVSYEGGAETDIIYQGWSTLGPGRDGATWCDDDVDGTKRCDQHYVAFDNGTTSAYGSSAARALACHETGHGVGLLHGQNAEPTKANTAASLYCLKTPVTGADRYLGDHNVKQINRTY